MLVTWKAGEAIKEIGRQSVLLPLILLWVNLFDLNKKEAQSINFDVATLAFFMCSSRSREDSRNSYIFRTDVRPYSKGSIWKWKESKVDWGSKWLAGPFQESQIEKSPW